MSNFFGDLKSEGLEESRDVLGGFQPFDSDIYVGTIKHFYGGAAKSGAKFVAVALDINGREYREQIYITNKEGKNYFMAKDKAGKETGNKAPLPGFTVVNEMVIIALDGKELHELELEEKVVNVYDPDQKKELPTAVPMATEMLGKKVAVAIIRKMENKREQDASGKYVPVAETRDVNNIEKVFHPELKVTVPEAREGKEATFWGKWLEKNKGKTQDRREIKDGGTGAPAAAPKAGGSAPTARPSLFGKK